MFLNSHSKVRVRAVCSNSRKWLHPSKGKANPNSCPLIRLFPALHSHSNRNRRRQYRRAVISHSWPMVRPHLRCNKINKALSIRINNTRFLFAIFNCLFSRDNMGTMDSKCPHIWCHNNNRNLVNNSSSTRLPNRNKVISKVENFS